MAEAIAYFVDVSIVITAFYYCDFSFLCNFSNFSANNSTLLLISLPQVLMLRTHENEDVSKQIFVLKLFDKSMKYTENRMGSTLSHSSSSINPRQTLTT